MCVILQKNISETGSETIKMWRWRIKMARLITQNYTAIATKGAFVAIQPSLWKSCLYREHCLEIISNMNPHRKSSIIDSITYNSDLTAENYFTFLFLIKK